MNIPGDPGVGPQSAPQGIVEGHADEVELALAEGRGAEDGAAAGEAGPLQLGVGTEDCWRVVAVAPHLRGLQARQARAKGQWRRGN